VETTLEGLCTAIPVGVSGAVVTAVNHAEKGTSGMNLNMQPHMLALSDSGLGQVWWTMLVILVIRARV
jgi:hypothetical protein